jgi:hypothetical protein
MILPPTAGAVVTCTFVRRNYKGHVNTHAQVGLYTLISSITLSIRFYSNNINYFSIKNYILINYIFIYADYRFSLEDILFNYSYYHPGA